MAERYVCLVKIPNLKDIKIYEGEPFISNFPEIFKINLSEKDKLMLKEIYEHLK